MFTFKDPRIKKNLEELFSHYTKLRYLEERTFEEIADC